MGVSQFICQTCGRHWYGGQRPRPTPTTDAPLTVSPLVAATEAATGQTVEAMLGEPGTPKINVRQRAS
jgi:hypothetical protein